MVRTIPISWKVTAGTFAVAPDGSVFMQRYPFDLVEVNALGQVVWSAVQPHQVTGVFGHRLGSTWVVVRCRERVFLRLPTAAW